MIRENTVAFQPAEIKFILSPETKDEARSIEFYEALRTYNALIHNQNMNLIITPINRTPWLRILQNYLAANSRRVSDFSESPLDSELKPTPAFPDTKDASPI